MEHFKKDYDELFKLFLERCAELGRTIQTQAAIAGGSTTGELESERSYSVQLEESTVCSSTKKSYIFDFTIIMEFFEQAKFGNIFLCFRSENARRQFYDEANYFLVGQFSPETNLETKVFAFYMMFTLWHFQKHKLNLSLKIRLDGNAHAMISKFINEAADKMLHEIVVIHRELMRADAFIFVEYLTELGPYYKDYLNRR